MKRRNNTQSNRIEDLRKTPERTKSGRLYKRQNKMMKIKRTRQATSNDDTHKRSEIRAPIRYEYDTDLI